MSGTPPWTGSRHEPGRYEIRLAGHLHPRWTAWFDGLTLTHEKDSTTVLRGRMIDQAALHGVLQKVRDLGVPLVSVTRVAPDQHDAPGQPDAPPPRADSCASGQPAKPAAHHHSPHPSRKGLR